MLLKLLYIVVLFWVGKKIHHFYRYFKGYESVGKYDSKYKNVSKFDIKDGDFEELN